MAARGWTICLLITLAAGCRSPAPTTQPSSIKDRQDQALQDPMGYKVPATPDSTDSDNHNLKRDLNDVLNP